MAISLQQPVVFSGIHRQQYDKMSIAFLADQVNEGTKMTNSYHAPAPALAAVSVAAPTCQRPCCQVERPETAAAFPSLRLAGSRYFNDPYLASHSLRIGSFSNSLEGKNLS
jgi:hypothetical protein